ncbi:hypothetical protein MAR_014491 [Mya arenaria]|uniref:Uncharacterized protein n=1 Tax=Mya arenaria TaxID=6604 RepID=A0ABY7G4F8_MYAAR|nr:hypothetical protein MAR_014491 [Mya arenaria]
MVGPNIPFQHWENVDAQQDAKHSVYKNQQR